MLEELFLEVEEKVKSFNFKVLILALEAYALKLSKKTKINRSQRHRIRLLKESTFCHYCGIGLDVQTSTIDHIIPQSKGGKWTKDNLVLSCERCNHKKGCINYKSYCSEIQKIT